MYLRACCLFVLLSPLCLGKTLLILGDQLSSGASLPAGTAWPALLKQKLNQTHPEIKLVNISISGMSTQGGLQLLPTYLERTKPDWIILALGYQNMLNTTPLAQTKHQLNQLITQAKTYGHVLLVGSMLPKNHPDANQNPAMTQLYKTLSHKQKVLYLANLLAPLQDEDYALLNISTPNQRAQVKLLNQLWPTIKKLLAK